MYRSVKAAYEYLRNDKGDLRDFDDRSRLIWLTRGEKSVQPIIGILKLCVFTAGMESWVEVEVGMFR